MQGTRHQANHRTSTCVTAYRLTGRTQGTRHQPNPARQLVARHASHKPHERYTINPTPHANLLRGMQAISRTQGMRSTQPRAVPKRSMRARQWRAAQSAERHLTRVTAAPGRSTMRRPAASLPMRAPWLCRGAMRHSAAWQTAAPRRHDARQPPSIRCAKLSVPARARRRHTHHNTGR